MSLNLNSGYWQAQVSNMPFTTGRVFVVADSNNANANDIDALYQNQYDGTITRHSTIASAMDSVVANRNDIILVAPWHAETFTAQLDIDVAGVSVIGLGNGQLRPTLTINGAIDWVDISAANTRFENFIFAAPETDAQTAAINVDAAGVTVKNVKITGSQTAKNIVDCITITANADDLVLEDITILNTTVAINSGISIEWAADNVTIRNVNIIAAVVAGGIIDWATATNLVLDTVNVVVSGTTKPAITLDSNPTGLARYVFAKGTDTTIANNCNLGNALALFEIRVLEEFSVQWGLIPARDAE